MKTITRFIALAILVSCSNSHSYLSESIDPAAFDQKIHASANPQLIDVRTPQEFEEKHLAGAKNIDFRNDSFVHEISRLDKSQPVLLYCLSGSRSEVAMKVFSDNGFKEIYHLEGGLLKWMSVQKPVEEKKTNRVENMSNLSLKAYMEMVTDSVPVLVDFNAPWCGPCKQLQPIVDNIKEEMGEGLKLVSINTDNNTELAKYLGISSIPRLMVYKNGKLTWEHTGLTDRGSIVSALQQ